MTIADNVETVREIEKLLVEKLPVNLGVNKKNELIRLVYEVSRAGNLTPFDVIDQAKIEKLAKGGRGKLFQRAKKTLLGMRYPSLEPGDDPRIMPFRADSDSRECPEWDLALNPKTIFIEKSVRDLEWTEGFMQNFPGTETVPIEDIADGMRNLIHKSPAALYSSRRERVFLLRNRSAFIKECPCTKYCRRCGYWILNMSFGCPIDCSYCYLQTYSNAPGMVFAANVEDYLRHIERFDAGLAGRARIGTGEFADSLALDRYTNYSSYLVPFFRRTKRVVFELKTKTDRIDNVLKEEPHDNVVLSWSLNTPRMAERYEKGASSIKGRMNAACRASERGYKVGFHFDPIIHYREWEDDYRNIIEELFSRDSVKRNTVWISLGTLRYTPGLKQAAEKRFSDNLLFYEGEFFKDVDGKLRYPRRLRIDMYNKIAGWIRSSGVPCWIYLCMEPEEVWRKAGICKENRFPLPRK